MKTTDNLRVTETLVTVKEMLGAPGIPTSRKGLSAWIKREGIASSVRNARSREREFPLAAFPGETQAWYLRRHVAPSPAIPEAATTAEAAPLTDAEREAIWSAYEAKSDKHEQIAKTYLAALYVFLELVAQGTPKGEAEQAVSKSHGVKPRTLRNCRKAVDGQPRDLWLPLLAPDYVGGGRAADCDPEAWNFITGDFLRPEKPPFASCYRRLQRVAAKHGWTIPAEKTLQRRIERIPRAQRILKREGEERAKRTCPAQDRDVSDLRALEAVNADGHKFDVFVQWPDGEIGRPILLAWQDVSSGKIVAWRVAKTENSDVVRMSLYDLIKHYGIPDHAVLDNGRGFASKEITGGIPNRYRFKFKEEELNGILTALGVTVHWALPFHGQSKPIERAFGDVCGSISKHPEFAGAYAGNNPNNKPDNYGTRAVPLDRFIQTVASGINEINSREGRKGRTCNGRSFNDIFDESYKQSPVRKANGSQLRLCLFPAEKVRADRENGSVRLKVDKRNRYWDEVLSDQASEWLIARYNPADLHGPIHVYTLDNRYLCEAACRQPAGFLDSAAAKNHLQASKKRIKTLKQLAAADGSMNSRQVADLVPPVGDPVRPEAKVIQMQLPNPQRPAHPAHRPDDAADRWIDELNNNVTNIHAPRPAEKEDDDLIASLV